MKKKLLLCILCSGILLFFSACGLFGPQEYICEEENVRSVQIIRLDDYIEGEYRYDYTVLHDIEDISTFVSQLNDLDQSVNWGEPGQMDVGYVVIRVEYLNGDVDELYPNAQCFNSNGENNYGYFFFNRDQFDALIDAYVG